MTDGQEFNQTEFNSNLATLMRIDNALKAAANAALLDDFQTWFKHLGFLRREAIVKMKSEQINKCNEMFSALERKITVFYRTTGRKSFMNTKIDNELDKFEIFLREIMDKKGMLLRDTDSAKLALQRG